jgi:hypothetical protein
MGLSGWVVVWDSLWRKIAMIVVVGFGASFAGGLSVVIVGAAESRGGGDDDQRG